MRDPKDITILIADDEAALRRAIVFDFKRKGFKTFEASSGMEAIDVVRKNPVDVVLTDVRMPGGDGIELLDRIKDLNPRTPVVMFITGFADMSLEEAYHRGADAVFAKPFDRKALVAAVIKAVSNPEEVLEARSERLETDFEIELKFPELNRAIQGRVLNIGRGGIFVAIEGPFPSVEARASFRILFEQGSPRRIEGDGIVRWTRTQRSDQWPTGCGIEFICLGDACRKEIVNILSQLETRSFIPRN